MKLTVLLWGIPQAMRMAARLYPHYAERLEEKNLVAQFRLCLLYTSPSPRDVEESRMPSSA